MANVVVVGDGAAGKTSLVITYSFEHECTPLPTVFDGARDLFVGAVDVLVTFVENERVLPSREQLKRVERCQKRDDENRQRIVRCRRASKELYFASAVKRANHR